MGRSATLSYIYLLYISPQFVLFSSPIEHALICCNQLWFIHGRHVGVERQ